LEDYGQTGIAFDAKGEKLEYAKNGEPTKDAMKKAMESG